MDKQQFREQLIAMRQNYLSRLPEKIQSIRKIWMTYLESGQADQLALLRTSVHNLAGSGATFGYNQISDVAQKLEMLLGILLAQTETLSGVQQYQINSHLVALDISMRLISETAYRQLDEDGQGTQNIPLPAQANKVLFLVDDDAGFSRQFAIRVGQHGCTVHTFSGASELERALTQQRPNAIVMDMILPQGEFMGVLDRLVPTGDVDPHPERN